MAGRGREGQGASVSRIGTAQEMAYEKAKQNDGDGDQEDAIANPPGDRRRLPEVLWPVQGASPQVAVRALDIQRAPEGWQVALTVKATAMSYDQATDALTALRHQLAAELPDDALKESGIALDRASPPAGG